MLLCADDIEKQSFFSGAESMCADQNNKKEKSKKKVTKRFLYFKLTGKTLILIYYYYTHFLNIIHFTTSICLRIFVLIK